MNQTQIEINVSHFGVYLTFWLKFMETHLEEGGGKKLLQTGSIRNDLLAVQLLKYFHVEQDERFVSGNRCVENLQKHLQ